MLGTSRVRTNKVFNILGAVSSDDVIPTAHRLGEEDCPSWADISFKDVLWPPCVLNDYPLSIYSENEGSVTCPIHPGVEDTGDEQRGSSCATTAVTSKHTDDEINFVKQCDIEVQGGVRKHTQRILSRRNIEVYGGRRHMCCWPTRWQS